MRDTPKEESFEDAKNKGTSYGENRAKERICDGNFCQ